MRKIAFLVFAATVLFSCKKGTSIYDNIIPKPLHAKEFRGSFAMNNQIVIVADQSIKGSNDVAGYLSGELKKLLGWNITVETANAGSDIKFIGFSLLRPKNELGGEGYILDVNSDSIIIYANESAGLFYGVQTLLQAITPYKKILSEKAMLEMPCVEITDKPRFGWRGMHLDVSRHFFDKNFIKQYLDILAFHKLNVFHWHLTDDQGWRIEIRKYPELTGIGAWREGTAEKFTHEIKPFTDPSKPKYGGFYTQDDVKEIIQYAKDRFITIIPEIEMPGHSFIALYAYLDLTCTGKPWKKPDTVAFEFSDPFCAGNEKTFDFFEGVLSEVIDLFPSQYIHIGGDECKKTTWEKCPKCQKRIKDEGLKNVEELQSYFIKRIEKFVNSKGRQIIGWDEILEGGLAPGAAVMSWRGEEGGIKAAKQKHKVVMVPGQYLYFKSAYQDDPSTVSLRKTYEYNPVPDELSKDEQQYVIGVQGCIWTETSNNDSDVMEHLLPRISALSEIAWLPDNKKKYCEFANNLISQYSRFDAMGWIYYIHAPSGLGNDIYYKDDYQVTLSSEIPGLEIRYTIDGTEPAMNSPLYTEPIRVGEQTVLKAKSFLKNGKSSQIRIGTYKKVALKNPYDVKNVNPGLKIKVRAGYTQSLDKIDSLKIIGDGFSKTICIPDSMTGDHYALQFEGYIKILKEGVYAFFLKSDDGSRLYLNDELIVDYDGVHGAGEISGKAALKPGYYKLNLKYFEGNYGQELKVSYEGPDTEKQEIPEKILFH